MTNRELQQQLQTAFVNASPKSLPDDVIDACVPCEDEQEPRRKHIALWRPLVAAAAVLAVIVTGAALWLRQTPSTVAMTVSLDVNPSITLNVDDHEAIVSLNALNDDGTIVVGEQDWTGVAVEEAVGFLVDSMVQNGYLNETANSVLISVDGTDEVRMTALEQKLSTAAQSHITEFEGAVISQILTTDDELTKKAEKYSISHGKAVLIERIIERDPLKQFDDLAELSINDLNLICRAAQMPKVNVRGVASEKAYIGNDAALAIALAHAGVTEAQVNAPEVELDCEDGVMCYEVEFVYNGTEYEYEIDATNGAVLQAEKDDEDEDVQEDGHKEPVNSNTTTTEGNTGLTQSSATTSDPTTHTPQYLSEQQIKEAVLTHAGVDAAAVVDYEIEMDRKNGTVVYEIEFRCGDTEYEYRVDALTGKILFSEKETDRPKLTETVAVRTTTTVTQTKTTLATTKSTTVTTTIATTVPTTFTSTTCTTTATKPEKILLSTEEVKDIVLVHAGVNENDVRGYECELNRRNGRDIYNIEFNCKNTEYEYRVDALTGEVLFVDWETDGD